MPSLGNVFIEELPGHLRLVVEGNDPTHPWEMILTAQAAFNLGNELRVKAENLGFKMQTPVQAQSKAAPARRPPSTQFRGSGSQNVTGPQSSADGGTPAPPDSFSPQQPAQPQQPLADNALLGDSFA